MSDQYTPEFKARIVLQALKARETDTSIAQAYGVHPVTLSRWKKQLERQAAIVFGGGDDDRDELESQNAALREELERARAEIAVLRAVFDDETDIDKKVELVNAFKGEFGLNAVCEIVGLPKSTYYYRMADADG
jgi:putative transposase